jgi:membrane-associated protease RseP (regulator of RpoE activity)
MANWYYDEAGREVGPLSPAELKQRAVAGVLTANTRLRRDDGNWTTAGRIPGLLERRPPVATAADRDATGGLIPYKNAPALISYYLGVFSLIPILGLPLGIGAVVLAFFGFAKRRANPNVSGLAHAWVGLVLGGVTTLLWGGLIATGIVAAFIS